MALRHKGRQRPERTVIPDPKYSIYRLHPRKTTDSRVGTVRTLIVLHPRKTTDSRVGPVRTLAVHVAILDGPMRAYAVGPHSLRDFACAHAGRCHCARTLVIAPPASMRADAIASVLSALT